MREISKKLLALVLLAGLVLSSLGPVPVQAANDGKITVDNPKEGETYTLYRVFDLVLSPDVQNQGADGNTAYLYTAVNDTLKQSISDHTTYGVLATNKTSGGKMVIDATPLTDGTINPYDFSNWLSTLPEGNFEKINITDITNPIEANEAGDNVSWTGLPLGYYMVKSSLGTLVSLNTTDKDVTIHEKNPDSEVIKLTKQVSGGVDGTGTVHSSSTNDGFVDTTYANIGEELEFKITFNVHAYANKEYVLEDILPAGLTLGTDDPVVKLGDEVMASGSEGIKEYSYVQDAQKLTFTFSEKTIQAIAKSIRDDSTNINKDPKTIAITYKAKLNNSAVMSNHGSLGSNKNTVKLTYDKHTEAQPLKVEALVDVRTTDFNIFKYVKGTEGNTETPLAGATFKIYTKEQPSDGETALGFTKVEEKQIYNYSSENGNTVITTDGTGKFNIRGLKPGTYWIEETAAPDGYNKIQDRIEFKIEEDTENSKIKYTATIEGVKAELTEGEQATNTVKILNQKGAELPSTGGMGRTLIYTLGAIIFFGSLILLIARKRTKQDKA